MSPLFCAGANMAGQIYQPHITSYDYDCPISEAGGVGQPGIGGDNKFEVRVEPHQYVQCNKQPESSIALYLTVSCSHCFLSAAGP